MPDTEAGRQLGGCLRAGGAALVGAICSALASIFVIALMPTHQPGGHAPEFLEPLALFCALTLGSFGGITRATSKRLKRPAVYTGCLGAVAFAGLFWLGLRGGALRGLLAGFIAPLSGAIGIVFGWAVRWTPGDELG